MGQKVNPHGLRVGIIKDWDSRWFANKATFGDTLVEDYNIRELIKKELYAAGIPRIEIERFADKVRVHIHCAKPGIVIGRGGENVEKVRLKVEKMISKTVLINIVEVKSPDLSAQIVAESIAAQLENRASFRRAMKQAIGRAMKLGAKGIKTRVSGRLGGAEIARSESYNEGTIPLQTIRADIDYGTAEAHTTYGRLGVKVWIYKGEVLKGDVDAAKARAALSAAGTEKPERKKRPDNRNRGGGDRPRNNYGGGRGGGGFNNRDGGRTGSSNNNAGRGGGSSNATS
ncbi:MAG: 30S ribosomal protein S3 [Oscillospiraceae bacterium]|nr:30S ribosomal protein S3 [Oscillospiraceae bacterium]